MTLVDLLALTAGAGDRFEGRSPQDGDRRRIYGGLVAAQALRAAQLTVDGRVCHSMHGYFLVMGDPARPIDYAVERVRDGMSFCVRRIVASQGARIIFTAMASFQTPETGHEYQAPMPDAPDPDTLVDEMERWLAKSEAVPEAARKRAAAPQRIEMRWTGPPPFEAPGPRPPQRLIWMRAKAPIGPDPALHQAALMYASDMTLLSTALAVHGLGYWQPGVMSASLDHAVWLHRPTDFNLWHLYVQDAESTGGGRGFVRGRMYRQDGTLVASMTQEGLMRLRDVPQAS